MRLKAINKINSQIGYQVDDALLIEDDNEREIRLVILEKQRLQAIKDLML